jgi:hypothetical protein
MGIYLRFIINKAKITNLGLNEFRIRNKELI